MASFRKKGELQAHLTRLGESQASFAYIAGLHPSTIYRACAGQEIGAKSFAKIIRTLGFLNGRGAPKAGRAAPASSSQAVKR